MIDLSKEPRRNIRYVMFALRDNREDQLEGKNKVLLKFIKKHYEALEAFDGWENFSETWDIGTDEYTPLSNWDDPSRQHKWFTWGIDRLKICKNKGLPKVRNSKEGVMREFVNPLPYMVHAGYAEPTGKGTYVLDVKKLLDTMEERDEWPQVLTTERSLIHSEV